MTPAKPRAAVLISGGGTNLQAFIDRRDAGELEASLDLVVSNKADAYGLVRAKGANIATEIIDHKAFASREAFDQQIAAKLDASGIDFIVLAGFMRILSPWFVQRYLGRLINIHPALLPLYPGLNTHQRVLDAGDSHHGSTVHFVTEELDSGPCILQGRIPVAPSTNADGLMQRVQAVEHQIYPESLNWLATDRVRFENGQTLLDDEFLPSPVVQDFD